MNKSQLDPSHLDSSPSLSLDTDLSGFFREILEETLEHQRDRPEPAVQQYVVGLLEDAAWRVGTVREAVDRPLALLLSDALHAEPAVRFERLRQTGDSILLVSGLYREHLRRAGLEDRYVVAVGQRAYKSASSLLDLPADATLIGGESPFDLLSELAVRFKELMVLLRNVADTIVARAARSATDLAHLCERWLSDRSDHLGRMLRAHGVILDRALLSSKN
jgi:hypothetical protein